MKKRTWLYILLILLCIGIFFAYRAVDRISADTVSPEISITSEQLEISVKDPKSALLKGVTAKDKRDGDVTGSLVVESMQLLDQDGTLTVTYAAFDKAGNVTKAERQVKYTDYESPVFSLSEPLLFVENSSFDVLSVVGAHDVLDGDIQHRIRATSLDDVSISTLGTHYVQFRVTNSLGDTVEKVFSVEVYPSGVYEGKLTLTDYLVYLPVGSAFRAENYLDEFTYSRDTTYLRGGLPENFTLSTNGWVDTQTPGVYSLAYTVTYTQVNTYNPDSSRMYDAYSKLIVVVE